MTPKEAAEIIHTLRIYHKQCGGCYVKGDQEALKMAEKALIETAVYEEMTKK